MQDHQAKGYNCQTKGNPFPVGQKVLKCNLSQKGHLSKMKSPYIRPYEIVSRSENGLYFLKDKYSHCLHKPISGSLLVKFYEDKLYKVDHVSSMVSEESDNQEKNVQESDKSSDFDKCCKCTDLYDFSQKAQCPVTSTPIKSQIVIMSNKEMEISSYESDTISVGTELSTFPLCDLNVDNIEIEIVDDLNKVEMPVRFWPLGDNDRRIAALKFSLIINSKSHPVRCSSFGEIISKPPPISVKSKSDGVSLFNSLSILLTGRDTYSAIIRHVICNYIDNPVKFNKLKQYILTKFNSVKQYTLAQNICNFTTCGTEVEIIAFAQLSGFNVVVFIEMQQSAMYRHDKTELSDCKFYLSNASGCHFDPVLDASF